MTESPYRRISTGLLLAVKVTPNAAPAALTGLRPAAGGGVTLRLKVAAPPDKGRANTAVVALLAEKLGLARSAITIVAGGTDRLKQVALAGDADVLAARLDAALAALKGT